MKKFSLNIFRSVSYKEQIYIDSTKNIYKKDRNKYLYKVISSHTNLIQKPCIESTRILISRFFSRKKKISKHKRFQYLIKLNKLRKNKEVSYINKPIFFFFHKKASNLYYKKFKVRTSKELNKIRTKFRNVFNIPFTKKGEKNRMGKGKGEFDVFYSKLHQNFTYFLLHRLSKDTVKKLYRKIRYRLGGSRIKLCLY